MGAVFKAYDPELGRIVALKVCILADDTAATAIEHEARCLAKLAHPNVVAVYEVVRSGVDVVLAMEFVDGKTLRRWQHETAPTWRDVLACYIAVGQGLAAVHEAGLEHGDFKPDNVLVGEDGRARVVDFGIARRMRGASRAPDDVLDVQGMGTRAYMAPERMIDRPSDARADVFSFCVSIWESIYGTRPYAGTNIYELLESMKVRRLESGEPLPGTPSTLRKVLAAGISPRALDRPATMDVLLRALADVLQSEQRRAERRRRTGVVGLAMLLPMIVVLVVLRPDPDAVVEAAAVVPGPADSEAEEQEPSIERAKSKAARNDPFGAWVELQRVDEQRDIEVETLLRLGEILVDRGRRLSGQPRELTLNTADQVMLRAMFKARATGLSSEQASAQALIAEIKALSQDNQQSRRR